MTDSLPDLKNRKRRNNLFRYTFLAMLSYQLPLGIAFLGCFFNVAHYRYSVIGYGYLACITVSLTAIAMIRLKRQITEKFITFILQYQVWGALFANMYLAYAMDNLRHLVPVGCMLILFFVFIQSSLFVSLFTTVGTVFLYLAGAYLGNIYGKQHSVMIIETLYILIFLPVCFFLAYMAQVMQKQQKKIINANIEIKSAHNEIATMHAELSSTHDQLAEQNQRTVESICYAEMIQRSLLPGIERIKTVSPHSMFIWIPKDIVGGDIFYTYSDPETSIITLADCTGHGVPGAFLTMIVYSELRKIIMEESCRKPSDILRRLSCGVKTTLHKDGSNSQTDDGLDAGVCLIHHQKKQVIFAGARIPLFYVADNQLTVIQGDRQSLGYRGSDDAFDFTDHSIDVAHHGVFYLKTDGYTDQTGGPKGLRFGTNALKKLILDHHHKPFSEQRALFLDAFNHHKGHQEQKDDVTLIGFGLN